MNYFTMAHVVVTDKTFEEDVLKAEGIVLVDFWASWCMPCQMLGPILDELSEELGDKVKICKMNVDENRETSAEYNIMSIPVVFVFKDGKVVDQIVGLRQKEDYVNSVNKQIGD